MFQAASNDLKALQGMENPETFVDEVFGFHAQQAEEKALKAWIALLGKEYPLTHSLRILLDILNSSGVDISPHLALTEYTSFGVQFRNESLYREDEELDRNKALKQIEELFGAVDTFMTRKKNGE